MNELLLNRILRSPTLPALPPVAVEVLQAEGGADKAVAASSLAAVIGQDPKLHDRLLGTVNSPFYALPHPCGTIEESVVALGLRAMKVLTIGLSLVDRLMVSSRAPFTGAYWRRTVYCASAARTCAKTLQTAQVEGCFLTGLLMDVGMLVLADVLGNQYAEIVEQAGDHSRLDSFEREELDLSHADVAGAMARVWKLPDVLQVPMAYHHRPEKMTVPSLRAPSDVAHLAGLCADVFVGEDAGGSIADVRRVMQTQYQKGTADTDALLAEIARAAEGLCPVFDLVPDPEYGLAAVLERARVRPVGTVSTGRERRRAPRISRQGHVQIRPYLDGVSAAPIRVKFRDASSVGIGVIHSLPMAPGSMFLIELGAPPNTKRVLYTVIRCVALNAEEFHIGARLAPEEAQASASASSSSHVRADYASSAN